jgi:hypothetical protein
MHVTQSQGGLCPEPRTAPDHSFVSGHPDLKAMSQLEFYRWVNGTPDTRDGYVLTDAAHEALAYGGTNDSDAPGAPASVLQSAARYLERYGWIQGAYYDMTSELFTPAACMVGAIGMVCYGGPVEAPAQHFDDPGYLDFEEAVLHLDRYLMVEDGSESYEFNDAKGRQLADVLRVLRQAADTPADELIAALRVITARNAEIAALLDSGASLATPRTCPACAGPLLWLGGDRYWCATDQADVTTDGGDAR